MDYTHQTIRMVATKLLQLEDEHDRLYQEALRKTEALNKSIGMRPEVRARYRSDLSSLMRALSSNGAQMHSCIRLLTSTRQSITEEIMEYKEEGLK